MKVLNQLFKLVMPKYGIPDKHNEEILVHATVQVERAICLPPERMIALMKQLA